MTPNVISRNCKRWNLRYLVVMTLVTGVLFSFAPSGGYSEEGEEPKTPRKVCGKCEEGYATTGTTSAPTICKDEDPTLVQCIPIGSSRMAVCGDCPDGYAEVGSSTVPSQCGDIDGGRVSQCQLKQDSY